MTITDPIPRAKHDSRTFKDHGLDRGPDSSILAAKGYIELGLVILVRDSKVHKTPADVKAVNRFINLRRAVVEQVAAQVGMPGNLVLAYVELFVSLLRSLVQITAMMYRWVLN
ncbi:hypothetical protein ACN082_07660 [Rothia sp. CCM 9417]|uniref:hypothetical protein n=1 Tax=Rothia sp. CCM 9417 TaxID=3402657 RepID=UPI003AE167DE